MFVDRSAEHWRLQIGEQIGVGYLSERMDASVGAPSARACCRLVACGTAQCCDELALDCSCVRLQLPAAIPRTVVFDGEFVALTAARYFATIFISTRRFWARASGVVSLTFGCDFP